MRPAVNVLVLTLTLVVAGGLLVLVINRVRDSAARMQCHNNLMVLGISVHNYHQTFNRFPPAAMPNPNLPPERRLSWLVAIVPFVEATNLYKRLDLDKGWDAEENRFATLMTLPYLQCPTFLDRPPVSTLVPSHYVGIAGVGADAARLAARDTRAGFFGNERTLRAEDLEGCADRLLLAIETTQASGSWTAAGPPTARGLDPERPYLGAEAQFGGLHLKGVNAVFADGSVRFLPASLPPERFEALATIQGAKGTDSVGQE
jgi:prepilin-type processing-associated H-X9-DG protein